MANYFDLKSLSTYSHLSVKTLRKYLSELSHYRVGGKILVKQSDFDEWIERFRKEPRVIEIENLLAKISKV